MGIQTFTKTQFSGDAIIVNAEAYFDQRPGDHFKTSPGDPAVEVTVTPSIEGWSPSWEFLDSDTAPTKIAVWFDAEGEQDTIYTVQIKLRTEDGRTTEVACKIKNKEIV